MADEENKSRSGGVNFGGSGSVTVHGDVVGRDKITTTNTTGMSAADFAKVFDMIYQKVAAKPAQDQADIRDAVDTIKVEAKKEAVEGKPPDEKAVKLSSQALVSMAPDVLEVAAATLANPAAGVALIIRKVLDRAKAMGGGVA